jgi:dihydrolipoamide dehydrogenase
METLRSFEALVVGAGPGGYPAAIRLAELGKRTAIVEKSALGGICLNHGCIPSKALIHAADLAYEIPRLGGIGLDIEGLRVDVGRIIGWKREVVRKLTQGVGQLLKAHGVDLFRGTARFVAPKTVLVTDPGGVTTRISYEDAIVATGVRPIELPGFPIDGTCVVGSREALDMEDAPRRLLVIGGGYIGLELGMAWRKLGSEVVIVELLDRVLAGMDTDAVRLVEKKLKALGVEVLTRSRAERCEKVEGGLAVTVTTQEGTRTIEVDRVLSAVGMRPDTSGLGLETVGVMLDDSGFIRVDDRRRTSAEHVWAVGDCTGGVLLAHKATAEGLVAAEAIAGRDSVFDRSAIPWGVFTDPEIAGVGMTEDAAIAQGRTVRTGRFPLAALGRALAMNATDGFVKLVADAQTGELLGGVIAGAQATGLVAEVALAVETGATVEELARTIHLHPTLSEAVMEASAAVMDEAIHLPPPRRR